VKLGDAKLGCFRRPNCALAMATFVAEIYEPYPSGSSPPAGNSEAPQVSTGSACVPTAAPNRPRKGSLFARCTRRALKGGWSVASVRRPAVTEGATCSSAVPLRTLRGTLQRGESIAENDAALFRRGGTDPLDGGDGLLPAATQGT
jgi:hypothetical protein